jgi:hypothetical protein
MTDVQTGGIALFVFALVLLFIGYWFGWSTVFWILGATAVISVVVAFFSRAKV